MKNALTKMASYMENSKKYEGTKNKSYFSTSDLVIELLKNGVLFVCAN